MSVNVKITVTDDETGEVLAERVATVIRQPGCRYDVTTVTSYPSGTIVATMKKKPS